MAPRNLHVGVVGSGIGGLSAAIALRRAGAEVTVLEKAHELGEIGAGIQMFPNVSRFLLRWGVDEIMGENLVHHTSQKTWSGGEKAEILQSVSPEHVRKISGFPWVVCRRDHLLSGLADCAKQHGAKIIVADGVVGFKEVDGKVQVETSKGKTYTVDLLIGADGIKSTVRNILFPDVQPKAPSKVAAYRGVIPYEKVFAEIPEARVYFQNSMDTWSGPNGYVITYPISGGREMNVVTAFCRDDYVTQMERVDIDEFHDYYKDYHPVIRKVINLVGYTQRWPLLQMPRMKTWSNKARNVTLMGDAAHSMQNHMGQGAATAMEDGAFLGHVISEVIRGVITIPEAITLYEQRRIPKAWIKQQVSLVNGNLIMESDPEKIKVRDKSSLPESKTYERNVTAPMVMPSTYRPWQLYAAPASNPAVFFYDAEADADDAVLEYLQSKGEVDEEQMLSKNLADKWWGYSVDNGLTNAEHQDMTVKTNAYHGLDEADYIKVGRGVPA